MACQKNIIDVPLSPSAPAGTDLILFTLPDATSVLRSWDVVTNFLVPDDFETKVVAGGATPNVGINHGDTGITLTQFIGKRVRLYRTGIIQSTIPDPNGNYYSFDKITGVFQWAPAASTDEIFQITPY